MATRHDTSAYVFMLAVAAISRRAHDQSLLVVSSCEEEYVAFFHGAREALCLGRLLVSLHDISAPPMIPPHIYRKGAISLTGTESIIQRIMHMAINDHFARDHIRLGLRGLIYCATAIMVADPLTDT